MFRELVRERKKRFRGWGGVGMFEIGEMLLWRGVVVDGVFFWEVWRGLCGFDFVWVCIW